MPNTPPCRWRTADFGLGVLPSSSSGGCQGRGVAEAMQRDCTSRAVCLPKRVSQPRNPPGRTGDRGPRPAQQHLPETWLGDPSLRPSSQPQAAWPGGRVRTRGYLTFSVTGAKISTYILIHCSFK